MPHHHTHPDHPDTDADPTTFWEEKYGGSDIWSGRPNHMLVDLAGDLAPGGALDLGCGEGGDALWLAERGWTVTGLDISPTALGRAEQAALRAGVHERTHWVAADLAEPDSLTAVGPVDLVNACFLQTPLDFPRAEVLRRAAGLVAPGGHVLVVAHAAAPPWADIPAELMNGFPTPDGELADLDLAPEEWEVLVADVRERPATGPDGEHAVLLDSVVLARRR
jgi:SAM-dependent methyltransferase